MDSRRSLLERLSESWNDPAFIDAQSGQTLLYRDVWQHAHALMTHWADSEGPSGPILLTAPDGPSHLIVHLAAAATGRTVCPFPGRTPSALIDRGRDWTRPKEIISETIDLPVDPSIGPPSSPDVSDDGSDIHGIFFSSGTTGEPKGICLSRNGVFGAAQLFATEAGFTRNTRLLHMLPMGYMAGLVNTLLATFMAGGCVVHAGLFSPFYVARLWTDISRFEVNVLSLFPSIASIMNKLHTKSDFDRHPRPSGLSVHSTSAPIPNSVRRRFRDIFGYEIQNCYGITELGGPLALQRQIDQACGDDAGEPFAGVEIRIGPSDRLHIRAPFPMLGYLEGPLDRNSLRPVTDPQGFIDTGDVASFTDNVLTVQGRADAVINKGGLKVSPFVAEQAIRALDGVEDAIVLGVADDTCGERIVACVAAPKDREHDLRQEILGSDQVRQSLGNLTVDRVLFYREFPKSHLGKTLRRSVREAAASA